MQLKQIKKDQEEVYKKDYVKVKGILKEFRNNKLFKLLIDFRNTPLNAEFQKAGINFPYYCYEPFNYIIEAGHIISYHVMDDGGIRNNLEEISVYNEQVSNARKASLNYSEFFKIIKNRPSYFTTKDEDGYMLNGDGDGEETLYKCCIEYLKDYFWVQYHFFIHGLTDEQLKLITKYNLYNERNKTRRRKT